MTLMPVSNIWAFGSSWSNVGGSRWMSHRSSMPVSSLSAMSSGLPSTLNTWPSTPSPTGIEMPRPVLRTSVPRLSPSVGFMQMTRTRLSPICCATSATIVIVSPSSSASISSAKLISGMASGGNSTSTTGPAMATTRPSLSWVSGVGSAVTVISMLLLLRFLAKGSAVAEGFGTAHDFHDLGGDRVLAGAVHRAGETGDQVLGVVGGRLHGPLTGGVLRRRGVEQRGVHARFGVTREQPFEDLRRAGLELVVGSRALAHRVRLERLGVERQERTDHHFLEPGRGEARVDELHLVDVAIQERTLDRVRDPAGVLVAGLVGEPGERGHDPVVAVAEVALGLATDHDELVVLALLAVLADRALGGAEHRRVVRAAQSAIGGDDDVGHLADLRSRHEQRAVGRGTGVGEVLHHLR